MFNINIDSSRPRPPARRVRQRGPINFDVTIDSRGTRRDITRNLRRVPDPQPIPTPTPEDVDVALRNLILSLSLDATWAREEISLPSVVMELTSNFGYKIIVDSDVTVELPINDIQINVDAGLEALPIDLTNVIEAQADQVSLKAVELTLTNEIRSIGTEDIDEALEAIELTLTDGELGYKIIVDSDVTVDLPINDIQIDLGEQLEALPISLSVEDLEIEVAGNFDIPSMELTLPTVEVATTHDEALDLITITLTNEIEIITEAGNLGVVELDLTNELALVTDVAINTIEVDLTNDVELSSDVALAAIAIDLTNEIEIATESGDFGVVELELSNRAALDIVQESDVSASLTVLNLVTDQGIATDTVEVGLTNEFALDGGVNAEAVSIELTNAVEVNKDLEIDEISIDLSNLILLDTGINIEVPADAQGPDADEATTVTMVA